MSTALDNRFYREAPHTPGRICHRCEGFCLHPADPLRAAAEQFRDQVLALAAQMDREGKPRTAWEVRRALEPLIDALEGGAV
jgi:hypothetical protein